MLIWPPGQISPKDACHRCHDTTEPLYLEKETLGIGCETLDGLSCGNNELSDIPIHCLTAFMSKCLFSTEIRYNNTECKAWRLLLQTREILPLLLDWRSDCYKRPLATSIIITIRCSANYRHWHSWSSTLHDHWQCGSTLCMKSLNLGLLTEGTSTSAFPNSSYHKSCLSAANIPLPSFLPCVW